MAIQLAVATRNVRLDGVESDTGTSPTLELRTGAQPADCAAADSGSLVATIALPSDWMNAAATGSKTKLGTWQVTSAAAGTLGHFRLKTSGAVCKMQGSIGVGTGDLQVTSVDIVVGSIITVTAFTLNEANG